MGEVLSKRRQLFGVFLISLISFIFLSDVSWAAKGAGEKQYGDAIVIGYYGQPVKIDPHHTGVGISGNLIDVIFDSLVDMTPDGRLRPRLAAEWTISPDGLEWTFHLHKNILFHDGRQLTAEDVKNTYEEIISRRMGAYYNMLKQVGGIEVIDKLTIKFRLNMHDNLIPIAFHMIGIPPRYGDKLRDGSGPIGSGAFKVLRRTSDRIVLGANRGYFRGRPYLNGITVKFFPTQRANLTALASGEVDMLYLLSPKNYGIFKSLKHLKLYLMVDKVAYTIFLDNENEFFSNPCIRKALNFVFDRELMVRDLLEGGGSVITTVASRRNKNSKGEFLTYSYSPRKALQSLRKAGWRDTDGDFILDKNGKPFEFTLLLVKENDLDRNIARMVEKQLREIGVNVKVKLIHSREMVDFLYMKRSYDAAIFPFNLRYDLLSNYMLWHSSQIAEGYNISSYRNPDVDKLLDIARTELDEEKRGEAHMKFQKVIHDDPPGIFLFWRDYTIAVDKRFQGIPDRPFEFFKNLPNVWVPKEKQKYRRGITDDGAR